MSGCAAARNFVAALSVKIQTPSTLCSAARTDARSDSEFTGRPAPFKCRVAASLLTPMSSASPKLRAFSRYVTWPRCKMSKQPFVTTSLLPRARKAARHSGNFSHAMILLWKFTASFCLCFKRIQPFPHTRRLRRAPRLRIAAALRVRRVAVEDFGKLAEAAFVQDFFRTSQIRLRRRDGFWRKIPRARQRFAETRKRPRPRRAVVIRGFAARVLVAFVARPIGIARVVQQPAVVAANRERNGNRQRRKRAQRARHDEILLRRLDAAFRPFATDEAEADREETVAPQRVAPRRVAGDDARPAKQHVGEPAFVFEPEQFLK